MAQLERVPTLFAQSGSNELCQQLESIREAIRSFARGVYPRALSSNQHGEVCSRDERDRICQDSDRDAADGDHP
jgi:hypothetical protein